MKRTIKGLKIILITLSLFAIDSYGETIIKSGGSFVPVTDSYRHELFNDIINLNEQSVATTAWIGERVNFQVYLWNGQNPSDIKVKALPLSSLDGNSISSDNVKLDFLKFIKMNRHDAYVKDTSLVELVPEMLNGDLPIVIGKNRVQPLWIGVNIPQGTEPGDYKGAVSVNIGADSLLFLYTIKVLNLKIPDVKDWNFNLNLWTHPQAAAHYYSDSKYEGQDSACWHNNLPSGFLWSDEHLALYRPTLEMLRNAGLKTITVNLVKDPWRSSYNLESEQHQTNYPYDELIHWTRKKNGRFAFDFKDFERYVNYCMSLGIDRNIECYSMLPWISNTYSAVTCFDEESGKEIIYKFKDWAEYDEVWSQFMSQFVPLLNKNGWFEKTRIGVDERGLKNIPHVLNVLKRFSNNGKMLGVTAAANQTHSFDDELCVISMHGGTNRIVNDKWSDKEFADWASNRRDKGLQSTWYTCTGTYPGNFGNSRPAESLFIGWYTAAIGADGYLRWAVDSWNDNPTVTTDHKVYETGDTFQVYPGDVNASKPFARSSVRFELLRQGIVDYEKIRMLKLLYPQSAEELNNLLESIKRPSLPPRIKGNSSLVYDQSTINDFSGIMNNATKELNRIAEKYAN